MSYLKPKVERMCDTILPSQQVLRFVIPFLTPVSISTLLTNRPGKINQKASHILSHPFLHLGRDPEQYLSWKQEKAPKKHPVELKPGAKLFSYLWKPSGRSHKEKKKVMRNQEATANKEILSYHRGGFVLLFKIYVWSKC